MNNKNEEFLKILMGTFRAQAQDYLKSISLGLLKLEKEIDPNELNLLFRKAHSLKGAARSVNSKPIEAICQKIEDIFDHWRKNNSEISPVYFDRIHNSLGLIEEIVQNPEKSYAEEVENSIANLSQESSLASSPNLPNLQTQNSKSLSFSITDIDELFYEAEELLLIKQNQETLYADLVALESVIQKTVNEEMKDIGLLKNEKLSSLDSIRQINSSAKKLSKKLERDIYQTTTLINQLLESSKKLLLQPFNFLSERFPQMMRSLARSLGKKVDFQIEGEDIQVDKRILETIKDSLIHLLRNAVDHGIELPEIRKKLGKKEEGLVRLSIELSYGNIIISIKDDGKGLDFEALKRKAVAENLISEERAGKIQEKELLNLIYEPGVTTSKIISEISGRGLGMSIVKSNLEQVNGKIEVINTPGKGAEFRLSIPANISTSRGLLIRLEKLLFFIPINQVSQAIRINANEVISCESRPAVKIGGNIRPFIPMGTILGCIQNNLLDEQKSFPTIIFVQNNESYAISVDEIICEQEMLIKPLGHQLANLKAFSGAALIGNNQIVPILNLRNIIASGTYKIVSKSAYRQDEKEENKRKILLAEDSITSQALLQSILESAGYEVVTANDGLDAMLKLRSEECDLLVSDVDMPGMNGFELTEKVKKSDRMKNMPVVLITARASKEDREHGIEVGADAYFVKSNFEQTGLLQVIERLL
jgi:two-component system chemotaxis sensor kinase CheA